MFGVLHYRDVLLFEAQKTSKRLHQFGLAHITKPMNNEQLQRMSIMAFERIMGAER